MEMERNGDGTHTSRWREIVWRDSLHLTSRWREIVYNEIEDSTPTDTLREFATMIYSMALTINEKDLLLETLFQRDLAGYLLWVESDPDHPKMRDLEGRIWDLEGRFHLPPPPIPPESPGESILLGGLDRGKRTVSCW